MHKLQNNLNNLKITIIVYESYIYQATKLPSINSSIRLRQFSPLETSRNTNAIKTRAESEHAKTERSSVKRIGLPCIQKI